MERSGGGEAASSVLAVQPGRDIYDREGTGCLYGCLWRHGGYG